LKCLYQARKVGGHVFECNEYRFWYLTLELLRQCGIRLFLILFYYNPAILSKSITTVYSKSTRIPLLAVGGIQMTRYFPFVVVTLLFSFPLSWLITDFYESITTGATSGAVTVYSQITWFLLSGSLWGSCFSIFNLLCTCSVCGALFVFFHFLLKPLCCLYLFDWRLLITPKNYCLVQLQISSRNVVSSTPCHERDLNSQL